MTPDEVRTEIDRLLGSIGLDTAPWAQQLLKSANSKNIDISEWNTFILKVAEVAASASTLQRISELLAQDLDINLRDGDYEAAPNAIYQNGGSKALSPYAAGLGHDCVAGGKGYKITGIVFGDEVYRGGVYTPTGRVTGYELWTVEGLEVDMIYSVRLVTAAYDCGKISKIDGNRIEVENPPQIKGFNNNSDDPENGIVVNVLTIKGRPDLGHIDVGFNAFSTGNDNYVSERNGFSSGTDNYVLGCNGASFGRENVAGYDALVWGRGNKALVDQSAVGGRFAKQSAHALLTLGNGSSESYRKNAFEVLSTGDVYNSGNTSVGKNLSVEKDSTFKGSTTHDGDVTFNEKVIFNGSAEFKTPIKITRPTGEDSNAAVDISTLQTYQNLTQYDDTHDFRILKNDDGTASAYYYNDPDNLETYPHDTLVIPGAYKGYLITRIRNQGFRAFSTSPSTLKSLDILEGIRVIEGDGFTGHKLLSSVRLPNTLTTIGYNAFQNCSGLTHIELPPNVKHICGRAFFGTKLKGVVSIPRACEELGYTSPHSDSGKGLCFGGSSARITSIVFEGTPKRIHPLTFAKSRITNEDGTYAYTQSSYDIYVPWSEGDVEKPNDSAWGSAGTVHYNYNPAPVKVVQGLGDSAEAVMSQNAVSKELEALDNNLIGIDTQIWSDLEPRIAALENSTPDGISTSVPLYRHCLDIHFNGELDTFSDTVELRMFCSIISSYGAPFEDLTDDPEYALGAQTHPATGCVISGGVCSPIVYFKGAHHPDGTGLGHVLIGCVRHKEFDGGAIGIQELAVHPYNFAEYTDTVVDTNVEI